MKITFFPALLTATIACISAISLAQDLPLSEELFSKIGGNSSLEDAKIVLLGDKHGDQEQDKLRQQILNKIQTDNDIMLIENREALTKVSSELATHVQLNQLTSKIKVLGWDDMKVHAASEKSMKLLMDTDQQRAETIGWMDERLGEDVFEKMQSDKELFNEKITVLKQQGLYAQFKNKMFKYSMLSKIYNDLFKEITVDQMKERNLSLIKTFASSVEFVGNRGLRQLPKYMI